MNDDVNFCPYCDSPSHKLLPTTGNLIFCRQCNSFFNLEKIMLKCPKCESDKIEDSDFPSPDGQIILQCKSCKKMFTAKELLQRNNVKG